MTPKDIKHPSAISSDDVMQPLPVDSEAECNDRKIIAIKIYRYISMRSIGGRVDKILFTFFTAF